MTKNQPDAEVSVFDDILLKERQALKLPCASGDLAEPCGSALAISGGGIRSASFALGVIQEFLNEKPGNAAADSDETCFDRFDYTRAVGGKNTPLACGSLFLELCSESLKCLLRLR